VAERTGIFTWLKAPATIYNPPAKNQVISDYRGVLQQVNGAPSDTRRIEEKTLETSDFVNPVCNREIAAAWSSSRRVTADAHRNRKNIYKAGAGVNCASQTNHSLEL